MNVTNVSDPLYKEFKSVNTAKRYNQQNQRAMTSNQPGNRNLLV